MRRGAPVFGYRLEPLSFFPPLPCLVSDSSLTLGEPSPRSFTSAQSSKWQLKDANSATIMAEFSDLWIETKAVSYK